MKLLYTLILLLLSCSTEPTLGLANSIDVSSDSLLKINNLYCGIDNINKFILFPLLTLNEGEVVGEIEFSNNYYKEVKINDIKVLNGQSFNFGELNIEDTFKVELNVSNDINIYNMIITNLSTVLFFTTEEIIDEPKIPSKLYINDLISNRTYEIFSGIEIRGGTSQDYPKVSYDIEIWEDENGSDVRKERLFSLRDSDDWILDAMYIDLSLSRNLFGMKLWDNIGSAIHLSNENNAKLSQSGTFIELFINNEYLGIYSFNEQIDRKQLGLKKNGGLLYKGEEWTDETRFKGINYNPDASLEWAGYELKHPDNLDSINWIPLINLIDLTAYAEDDEFIQKITQYLDFENIIDYFIFINLIQAEDNIGKNMYLFRYDDEYPISFSVWDLDLTFGNKNSIWTSNSSDELILRNLLFDRLYLLDVDNYIEKISNRWEDIIQNINFNDYFQILENNKSSLINSNAINRNNIRWDIDSNFETEVDYLKTWIDNRMIFFDNYIDQYY